jgi:hypothetical protein
VVGRVKPSLNFIKNSFQAPVVERSVVIATVNVPKACEHATLSNLTTVSFVPGVLPY